MDALPRSPRARGQGVNAKQTLRVITNSELKVRRRCPREHHIMYDLRYRSVHDADALRFGKYWHKGLEAWWHGQPMSEVLEAGLQGSTDPYEIAILRVLLRGYDVRWRDDTSHVVVAVEQEFRAPVRNPETGALSRTFALGGVIDVQMQAAFMEHKTTSEDIGFGSVYWRTLLMDSQISTYYAGCDSLGRPAERCIYDVVKKPTIRPSQVPLRCEAGFKIVLDANGERVYCKPTKKDAELGGPKPRETASTDNGWVLQTRIETPDEFEARLLEDVASNPDKYFQRGEVVRLESELADAQLDVWQQTRALREDELAGRHPRNADACKRWGRMCDFFDVCTGTASLEDASRFMRVDNPHQELSL